MAKEVAAARVIPPRESFAVAAPGPTTHEALAETLEVGFREASAAPSNVVALQQP